MPEDSSQATGSHTQGHAQSLGELDLEQLLGILRRRKWLVLTVVVVFATVGAVHAFKATPVYRAVAKVMLERQPARLLNLESAMQFQTNDAYYDRTQQELMRSRTILEKAAASPDVQDALEETGQQPAGGLSALIGEAKRTVLAILGTQPVAPREPWEQLGEILDVQQRRDTHILVLSVEGRDPKRAALLVNAVVRAFQDYHLKRKQQSSGDAFDFLEGQMQVEEEALRSAEEELQRFREELSVVSLDVTDVRNPVLTRLARLNEKLTEVQLRRVELQSQLGVVDELLKLRESGESAGGELLFSLAEVRSDPSMTALRDKLLDSEKEAAAMADVYGPGHPQHKAATARATVLRQRLEQRIPEIRDAISAQLEMVRQEEGDLESEYAAQNDRALKVARDSLTYNRLESNVSRHRKLFDVLVERTREVDITAEYAKDKDAQASVEVVEEAAVPQYPVRPRKMRIMLLSVFLGLFAGLGLAFVRERLDDTIKTPEDLEGAGVPVLGFVPDIDNDRRDMDDRVYAGIVSQLESRSPITEAYRSIRTSLSFSASGERTKAVVITSGDSGDGKTTTASNLALVIAQGGKRVLLLDADLRKPAVHRIFGLSRRKGLSNVLVGQCGLNEALQTPSVDGKPLTNLSVVCAGPENPPNPAELLDSQAMRDLLADVRGQYDQIVIDTPPLLVVTDAAILGGLGCGVVLVAKSGKNPRAVALRARELLEDVHATILGGVVNDVQEGVLRQYYSGYYHYGYARRYEKYYGSGRSAKGRGA